ncbi:hypothetical protein WA026_023516 [Henosepilachna vigintioctopunctata]|uniref:Uncharacterized protein n=1 Tax=Henosepilachna vigintioctopunctata TaxID=420089 RepID=A0AAW1TZ52_9CUCU
MIGKVNFAEYRKTNLYSIFDSLSHFGSDLLAKTLDYDTKERITAAVALKHSYFQMQICPEVPSILPSHRDEMKTLREKRKLESTESQSDDQLILKRAVKRKKKHRRVTNFKMIFNITFSFVISLFQ